MTPEQKLQDEEWWWWRRYTEGRILQYTISRFSTIPPHWYLARRMREHFDKVKKAWRNSK